ncbi:MAG: porin family protein [Bacteroidetes bacterium]|nr:porin family protein [Bacteroidota bacterium]
MKQTPLFALFLLMISFSSLCQESTDRFRIGIGYTPYLILKKEKVNDLKGTFSNSFGVNGSLKCANKLRLDLGVHYSNRKYIQSNVKFTQNLNQQTGVYDTTFAFNYSSRFIEIPVSLNYQIGVSERVSFFVGLGLSQQISLNQSNDWTAFPLMGNSVKNYKTETNNYSLSATGVNLSIGMSYKLGDHFLMQVEPFLRNYFTQKPECQSQKTSSLLGCNIQILYTF